MWCRVFGTLETTPTPEELFEHLRGQGQHVEGQVEADDLGWFQMVLTGEAGTFNLERYLASEGIRDDLNTWAAWLEIHAGDRAESLMLHMIFTKQLITLRRMDLSVDEKALAFLEQVARWLAERTGGVYQIDGRGFFGANGSLLAPEGTV